MMGHYRFRANCIMGCDLTDEGNSPHFTIALKGKTEKHFHTFLVFFKQLGVSRVSMIGSEEVRPAFTPCSLFLEV